MKTFAIYCVYNEKSESWQAGAVGRTGLWSRSLTQAIESLLNELIILGIESKMSELESPAPSGAGNLE